jgi:hypothetical protein
MVVGKAGAYSSVELHKRASLLQAQALAPNIWLGLRALLGTNTLTYYEHSKITDVKSFMTLCPGSNAVVSFHFQALSSILV